MNFFSQAVEYLGHRIDSSGLHTTEKKVEAIRSSPQPENVQQLKSFLGLLWQIPAKSCHTTSTPSKEKYNMEMDRRV